MKTLRFLAAGDEGVRLAAERARSLLRSLGPVRSWKQLSAQRPALVVSAVREISAATAMYDAFDVIECMRMRESPISLVGFSEQEFDGIQAAIEIAALLLTSRGCREVLEAEGDNAGEAVPVIHDHAQVLLLRSALAVHFGASRGSEESAIADLGATLQATELAVRNAQYESIRARHDGRLFGDENVSEAMARELGFGYKEFSAVRTAIRRIHAERLTDARDAIATLAAEWQRSAFDPTDTARVNAAREAFDNMLVKPGRRAAFTAHEVAVEAKLDEAVTETVLDAFSIEFEHRDPVELLTAYMDGDNPFRRIALVKDDFGNYIALGQPLGDDSLRNVLEESLDGSKFQERYVRARTRMSESFAAEYFEKVFGRKLTHRNFVYYAPKKGAGAEAYAALGRDAANVPSFAERTEMDALIVADDVAICVEVKGKSLRRASRRGNALKLATDLRGIIGEANEQAERLRRLVTGNGGLWTSSGWLDLSRTREVHSVAVTLDDLGPAGIALDHLVRGGVIRTDRVPWVVSLHDLAVVTDVIDLPCEFLLYLRRRTGADFSRVFLAIDELDLFMLFLSGGMYVEADPDKVYEANPVGKKPGSRQRRAFRRSRTPVQVGTHTDPLDQWMYALEAGATSAAPKPSLFTVPGLRAIIEFLNDGKKPGWLTASTELLAYDEDSQSALADAVTSVAERTRADKSPHTAMMSTSGEWGTFAFFVVSRSPRASLQQGKQHLQAYLMAKGHQVRADRSLGLLVSPQGAIESVLYRSVPWAESEDLDALGRSMNLKPVRKGRPRKGH